ncbi:MAG: NapC/NirT family cytochrome c [Acidobacteriota bacterium]
MDPLVTALAVLGAITFVLVAVLVLRPNLLERRGGKVIAFVAFFILPLGVTALGTAAHLENAKSTEFCVSCHVMEPYGDSMMFDDLSYLPAAHYQNHWMPPDRACYSCHTQYTMFGDVEAKMKGLQHVWVYYFGAPLEPGDIELYDPYENRECLHCHAGARSYEENEMHVDIVTELTAGEISCLDCHSEIHAAAEAADLPKWQPEGDGDV